jgi:hypothetical protein
MTRFRIGDRVFDPAPINEAWDPAYTATVLQVRGDLIDIRWDHGPTNSGHFASDFEIRRG